MAYLNPSDLYTGQILKTTVANLNLWLDKNCTMKDDAVTKAGGIPKGAKVVIADISRCSTKSIYVTVSTSSWKKEHTGYLLNIKTRFTSYYTYFLEKERPSGRNYSVKSGLIAYTGTSTKKTEYTGANKKYFTSAYKAYITILNSASCTNSWLLVNISYYTNPKDLTTLNVASSLYVQNLTANFTTYTANTGGGSSSSSTSSSSSSSANTISYDGIDIDKIMEASGLYSRSTLNSGRYNKYFKYGHIDPYNAITNTKEYLFFTRPDLNIFNLKHTALDSRLAGYPFFQEMYARYPQVLEQLTLGPSSYNSASAQYLCPLLSYHVSGNIGLPSSDARTIDTPENIYGISVKYRGDGRSSDFGYSFSLQFTDDKQLTCYRYFKAWEEYERIKTKGLMPPPTRLNDSHYYQNNKILHDQIGIFKFIVGEDGKTIIYYAYYLGCFPKTVPRDSFEELSGNPTYSIDWECFRVIDMDPRILSHFNQISSIPASNQSKLLTKSGSTTLGTMMDKTNRKVSPAFFEAGNDYACGVGTNFVLADSPFIARVSDKNYPIVNSTGSTDGYSYQLLWYDSSTNNYKDTVAVNTQVSTSSYSNAL